jgi:hypothetical protein
MPLERFPKIKPRRGIEYPVSKPESPRFGRIVPRPGIVSRDPVPGSQPSRDVGSGPVVRVPRDVPSRGRVKAYR